MVGVGGERGAKRFACVLPNEFGIAWVAEDLLHFEPFAYGNKFHFRRDDALAGIVHLGNVATCFGTARLCDGFKTQMSGLRVVSAFFAIFAGQVGEHFSIAALI